MSITMFEPMVLRDRHYTVEDLADRPDDGLRYEIIDGVLVVTGSPSMRHQRAVGRMYSALVAACTPGLEVFVAPFAVELRYDSVIQPDVLVARVEDLTESELPAPPVLAVEVLSPGTRHIDLDMKLHRMERAGTPSYWVVDPSKDPDAARLMAWQPGADGTYHQVADVHGGEVFEASAPFPVLVRPADLVR
jgi:Uma2 family endonuclease